SRQSTLVGYSEIDPGSPIVFNLPIEMEDGWTAKFWAGNIDDAGQKSELIDLRETYTAV
ncbi:unnamed protein product, partial [marine sediment metagenome]